jgi:hypothetical protein
MTIRAAHYGETERQLMNDHIVIAMAHGLIEAPHGYIVHDNGQPRFEFMQAANREYESRGGTNNNRHIGAIANAIVSLLHIKREDI